MGLTVQRRFTEIIKTVERPRGLKNITVQHLTSGQITEYKVYEGIWYEKEAEDSLILALNRMYKEKTRIRLFYGDKETGEDYFQEFDIMGTVGTTTGEVRAPILVSNSRSMGGFGILSSLIVKVVEIKTGRIVWQTNTYQTPKLDIIERGKEGFPTGLPADYTASVQYQGKNLANFENKGSAEGYVAFLRGEQHVKHQLKRLK